MPRQDPFDMLRAAPSISKQATAAALLRAHYRMQTGQFVSECQAGDHAIGVSSKLTSAPMWNHVAWLGGPREEFEKVIQRLADPSQHQRCCPALYLVSSASGYDEDHDFLVRAGFEPFDRESWMEYGGHSPEAFPKSSDTLEIVQAQTELQLSDFTHVFYEAFQVKEPGFAEALKQSFIKGSESLAVRHLIGYLAHEPVCIGTLIASDGTACVYNIGTSPRARKRGYAGALMDRMIQDWLAPDPCRRLFLQVTTGGGAERLYRKLGFQTAFARQGYRLRQWQAQPPEVFSQFATFRSSLALVFESPVEPRREANQPARESIEIPTSLLADLGALADRSGASFPTIAIAAWACLLSRYSLEESVSFGLRAAIDRSNIRSCKITVPTERPVFAWLQELHRECTPTAVESSNATTSDFLPVPARNEWGEDRGEALTNKDGPPLPNPLLPWQGREGEIQVLSSVSSLNSTAVGFAPGPKQDLESGIAGFVSEAARFETILDLGGSAANAELPEGVLLEASIRSGNPASISFLYDERAVPKEMIRRMAQHFLSLLAGMGRTADACLSRLEMLTPGEREQILREWNLCLAGPLTAKNAAQLFEAQVDKTPDATSVLLPAGKGGNPETLSYSQLNRRANRLAHQLRKGGVGPNVLVGIFLERSLEMMEAILGVWKAGGVVVPLDPAQPFERLAFLAEDTKLSIWLTERSLSAALPKCAARTILLEPARPSIDEEHISNLPATAQGSDLAYIIYTSGSTGTPKGVMISNAALAQHCLDMREYYELSATDRVLQFAAFHFDAAFEQIVPALLCGASLVLRPAEIWNVKEFGAKLSTLGITVADLPTAYWHQLAQDWAAFPASLPPHRLRLLIIGGERMSPTTLQLWRRTPMVAVRLVNAYGPTEATITATRFDVSLSNSELSGRSRIPIGRPCGQRRIYILDRFGNPVPIGVPGELHIGGPLLASGYLNRPELTAEKFVPDRFSSEPGARLYRTGDFARWRADGTIDFLGRLDDQVKIRGFRVELGEIEAVLHQNASVKEAAVVVHDDPSGHRRLIAYVALKSTARLAPPDLRAYLKQKLPDYMVPSAFMTVDALPLTASGKVNRRALPQPPTETCVSANLKGPRDPLQLRVELLFERVLKRCPIGVNASFFELGGDSLQALELIVAIERAMGKNLPLETLYRYPTVEKLADVLRKESVEAEYSSLVPLQPNGTRPPLFLIHTTPGDVLGYGNLVYHLSPDQPCYGLQSLGLARAALSHTRIEEMAAHYLEWVRELQPHGPYFLGGWCYGGIVAVEMAKELVGRHEEVALLALFETPAPAPGWRVPRYYLHRAASLLRMKPSSWLRYFRAKLKFYKEWRATRHARFARLGFVAEDGGNGEYGPTLAQMKQVFETNLQALKFYRSSPYGGRVTLFNAAEVDPTVILDRQYGWVGLAAEIEVHSVAGNHDTMLMEPHVAMLAEQVESCLQRAQNQPKPSQTIIPRRNAMSVSGV